MSTPRGRVAIRAKCADATYLGRGELESIDYRFTAPGLKGGGRRALLRQKGQPTVLEFRQKTNYPR
jgi:hypothetical protein